MNIDTTETTQTTEPAIGFIPCYRLPFLSLFHADCMEIMKQYPDKYFDLAIVDPPYGIGADKAQNNAAMQRIKAEGKSKAGRGWKLYADTDWDNEIPTIEYWEQLFRVSKNQIVWGGNYFTEYLPPSMGWIMWDKGQRDFSLADGELAWTSFNKALRIFEMSRGKALAKNNEQGGRFHPTQKPEMLYSWILHNYAKQGDLILDTHFGSGSIALAVDKANRLDKMNLHLTACEIDKEYIDKAIKRISESIKQGTLPF
jgi:site-specific DNA-methyltransferase (adenine-specific)